MVSQAVKPRALLHGEADNCCVRFADVEKTYDGRSLVVKRLNLDVRDGEFLTLLGPSGSGKTTSLMMLAGFEAPTAGSISLHGNPIQHLPPHRRGIGVVFQNYALFPHLSIEENISFPLRMRSVSRADAKAKVDRALDMVRMRGFGDRKPGQLSGGQQQRIALARALVFEPRLVLMDEPLGALDKQLREHMQLEIKQLHHDLGISIVYVTHDQGEALTMSDRIAIFNDGVVQQLGGPKEIYDEPATPFVAQFIGDNNIFACTVISADRECLAVQPHKASPDVLINAYTGADGVKPGQAMVVAVRPEKIGISAVSRAGNALPAKVSQCIYYGDHVRVQAEAAGITFAVKAQNRDLAGCSVEPGSSIYLHWQDRDCHAFASAH